MKTAPVLVFAVMLLAPAAASAAGPCDEFTGQAWGLCHAYCDALDCGCDVGDVPSTSKSCTKLGELLIDAIGGSLPWTTSSECLGYGVPLPECSCTADSNSWVVPPGTQGIPCSNSSGTGPLCCYTAITNACAFTDNELSNGNRAATLVCE
jgi:hypothetical protein